VARGLYRAGRRVYDDAYERWRALRHDRLTLSHIGNQNALHRVRTIEPNERGRYPLLVGTDGTIRNPNTLARFTIHAVNERYPFLENIDGRVRALEAAGGWPTKQAAEALLPETDHKPAWPSMVTIGQVFADRQPSIHDLVVGVKSDGELVSDSIHNLMHVLSVGASGWGKSSWLRAFLWQIAKATEPVEVIAIDVNGSEFNALRGWGKLRYPVARTAQDAGAVLGAVIAEIGRRGEMYERHPMATKLSEYNQATGAGLPPWVVAVDEGTNLMHKAGIGDPLRELVQTARQYGVYVLLVGQTAKATVIDTEIRDQFSTRLCFHTSPPSSRVVLDDKAASEIHAKGRAIVQMVGREQEQVLGPWVTRGEFIAALDGTGPQMDMPESETPIDVTRSAGLSGDQVNEIMERWYAGEKVTPIALAVFGYGNPFYIAKVRKVINEYDNTGSDGETGTDDGL
jgi:DNA segregation ATPase FtsK/SpoIIIE-like protein